MGAGVDRAGLVHGPQGTGQFTGQVAAGPCLRIDFLQVTEMLGEGILDRMELLKPALGLLRFPLGKGDGARELVGNLCAAALELILLAGQFLKTLLLPLDLILLLTQVKEFVLGLADLILKLFGGGILIQSEKLLIFGVMLKIIHITQDVGDSLRFDPKILLNMGFLSLSKNGASNPHQRCPLLHGHLIVAAHSHREDRKRDSRCAGHAVPEFPKHRKEGSRSLRVGRQRGHGHESLHLQARQSEEFLDPTLQIPRGKTVLGPLPRDIDLQQHLGEKSLLTRDPVDVPRKIGRVDAMDELKMRQRLAHLVRLEMSDEVPPEFCRQQRDLRQGLLNAVFTEKQLPRLHGLADPFSGMRFGDGYQVDGAGPAPREALRRQDRFLHQIQFLSNGLHTRISRGFGEI